MKSIIKIKVMKVKNSASSIVCLAMIALFMGSCTKGSVKEKEEGIKFETDALESNICSADKFTFTVKLLSVMPSNGIKLSVNAKEEGSGVTLDQDVSLVSKGTQTALNVKGLPKQKWVLATVKVCSAKDTSNCISKTFKVVFK
jgi:hypothetical protein